MAHDGDVTVELTSDHREVEDLFARIEAVPSGHEDRKRLMDQVTIELVQHAVAEEAYLYPAVREHLSNGNPLADKEIEDHAAVERTLKELEGCTPDDARFDQLFNTLRDEVTSHVQDEENNLFVQLRATCSQEILDQLGDKIRTAKKTAPTRPHPSAPDQPPLNKLLAPGAGLVDRVRDFVSGRGKS